MTVRAAYLAAAMLVAMAGQAGALSLADCTRITHISHGGEALHRDMGEGRVMWLDWWSQEGSAHDLVLVECATNETLRLRTAEENMSARPPFHRTERIAQIVEDQHDGARVFATLPRIAEAVRKDARDIALTTDRQETCACAALYPDLRGDKTEFTLGGQAREDEGQTG